MEDFLPIFGDGPFLLEIFGFALFQKVGNLGNLGLLLKKGEPFYIGGGQ